MPDDITIVSTTDSQEAVNLAAGLPADAGKKEESDDSSEKVASAGTTGAAADETAADSETAESEGSESKKGKGGFKKKIEKLQAELAQHKADLDKERAERRQEIEERQRLAKAAEAPPKKETPTTSGDRPKAEDFKTLEEWVEAVADWKADQRDQSKEAKAKKAAAEEQEKQQIASAEAVKAAFKERVIAFKEDHPDYDEKIKAGWHAIPEGCYNSLYEMENGAEVVYYLAQHPEVSDKLMEIGTKSVLRGIAEIWKVSESLASATPPPRNRSNAPPPPSSVSGAATRSSVPLDEMDFESYKAARAAGRIH